MTPQSIQEAAERIAKKWLPEEHEEPFRERLALLIYTELSALQSAQPAESSAAADGAKHCVKGDGSCCYFETKPAPAAQPSAQPVEGGEQSSAQGVAAGGVPTPDEARAILSRFNASHFDLKDREHARYRIPADPKHDDDIRLSAFIDYHERILAALERAERERDEAREEAQRWKNSANHHRDLGITLLDAKYLDPNCHKGCKSLVHQHRITALEAELKEAREELAYSRNELALAQTMAVSAAESHNLEMVDAIKQVATLTEHNRKLREALGHNHAVHSGAHAILVMCREHFIEIGGAGYAQHCLSAIQKLDYQNEENLRLLALAETPAVPASPTPEQARIAALETALEACVSQIEHLEALRAMNCGPIPATLTADVLAQAAALTPASAPTEGGSK